MASDCVPACSGMAKIGSHRFHTVGCGPQIRCRIIFGKDIGTFAVGATTRRINQLGRKLNFPLGDRTTPSEVCGARSAFFSSPFP